MTEIRLVLAAMPTMLSEIIRNAVEQEPDLRIVGERETLDGLREVVQQTLPHVLVVGAPDAALPRECARSMYDLPHTGALVVSYDGRLTSAWRLRPQGVHIENVSTAGVVEAIRQLSRPPAELGD